MHRLHGISGSGNCYKPKLLLSRLQISFSWIVKDLCKGETRTIAASCPKTQDSGAA